MLDDRGTVIYVGKAVSLKNRVRQYFQASKNHDPKVSAMVAHIDDFETIVVANESEALSLESNLIKEFMPKYNILLKDDKHFPYVRFNMKQDFPRMEIVRRVKNDGAVYLGPYLSANLLKNDVSVVKETFPLRHCKKNIERAIARRERPCLMYQLKKCCAPCSGKVSPAVYKSYVAEVIKYLSGKTDELIVQLRDRMYAASARMDYEEAAILRDRIASMEALSEKQVAITVHSFDADAFAAVKDELTALVYAVFVRGGKIIGTDKYEMQASDADSPASILSAFLAQYYLNAQRIPPNVLLSEEPDDREGLELWLSELGKRRVRLTVPKRGDKAKITALARENGSNELEKTKKLLQREWQKTGGALLSLGEILSLNAPPHRIECFDNSHTGGSFTVSSMVVFIDGQPCRTKYRRFRITSDTHGDDLLAMHEALMRRFARDEELPDLLIVDGGKEQLKVACQVLESLGLDSVFPIGLAERHETIYLRDQNEPIALSPRNPALHLLQRVRDEAHRFAISYHRQLQQKKLYISMLDGIPGIGDARKLALLEHFISIDEIKKAPVDELSKVKGMTRPAAEAVYSFFHENG